MDPNPYKLGQYQIRDHIGVGGFGIVYRAQGECGVRGCAIKVMPNHDVGPGELPDDINQSIPNASSLNTVFEPQ